MQIHHPLSAALTVLTLTLTFTSAALVPSATFAATEMTVERFLASQEKTCAERGGYDKGQGCIIHGPVPESLVSSASSANSSGAPAPKSSFDGGQGGGGGPLVIRIER